MYKLIRTIMRKIYLKKTLLLLLLFNAFLLVAQNETQEGVIRIKLEKETAEILESKSSFLNTKGEFKTGVTSLDQALSRSNISKMKRIFPNAGKYESKHRKYGLHQWYEVEFNASRSSQETASEFTNVDGIEEIALKPVYTLYTDNKKEVNTYDDILTSPPNDPNYNTQWGLNNTGQNQGTNNIDVNCPEAWEITTGTPDVIVAVIDTGVDSNHDDLAPNMWVNDDEIPNNGIDDDNNGYVDDIHGYFFAGNRGDVRSFTQDHGSHVSGTVGAVNNNGIGVAGVAGGDGSGDGIRLMSCGIFTDGGQAANIPSSFIYAADNGAVIAQNSWGSTVPTSDIDPVIRAAIDYFIAEAGYDENQNPYGPMQGGLVIFAAGNSGSNTNGFYPGFYPRVIAVGAIDRNNNIANFSNYGDWVDIVAPGVDVISTFRDNQYGTISGTSMATPHVSGAAALIVSQFAGNITPEEVRARLLNSARDFNYSRNVGGGLLNIHAALTTNDIAYPELTIDNTPLDINLNIGDRSNSAYSITNTGDLPVEYSFRTDGGTELIPTGRVIDYYSEDLENTTIGMNAADIPDWHEHRTNALPDTSWKIENIDPASGSNHLYIRAGDVVADNPFNGTAIVYTAPANPSLIDNFYSASMELKLSSPQDLTINLNGADWFNDLSSGFLSFKKGVGLLVEGDTVPESEIPFGEYFTLTVVNEVATQRQEIFINGNLVAVALAPFNQVIGSLRFLYLTDNNDENDEVFVDDISFQSGELDDVKWLATPGVIGGVLQPGQSTSYDFTINALPFLFRNVPYTADIVLESNAFGSESIRLPITMTVDSYGDNLALDGVATQSSTGFNGVPSRAIDGNINGVFRNNSVTHTTRENNPWWQVQLPNIERIGKIALFNRIDCCSDRLTNFTVTVINNGNIVFSRSYTETVNGSIELDARGIEGNIIRIQLNELNSLSLAEVEVYEHNIESDFFIPDPNKTYYIDNPTLELRLAATGSDEDAYTTNTTTTGEDVEWRFIYIDGLYHLQRASGGSTPRLRTDLTNNADMQAISSSGDWTRFEFPRSLVNNDAYYMTIPNVSNSFNRAQILSNGTVKMVPDNFIGNLVSFTFTEVNASNVESLSSSESEEVSVTEVNNTIPQQITVFPNPASNFIQISNIDNETPIKIYNTVGQIVVDKKGSQIDISSLNSGLYFINIDQEVIKFIKN